MNVWTYWEGPRPPYIDMCLQSMTQVCNEEGVEFRLITPHNLYDYIDKKMIPPNYYKLEKPSKHADYVRAALLATYGGWWWDADTVALRNPLRLREQYGEDSILYMTWTKEPRRILNGYIYMPPGCTLAKKWLNEINKKITENPKKASIWLSLGEKILTPLLDKEPDCIEIERELFLPIDIDANVSEFFETANFEKYISVNTVCYGLNHSWMMHTHKKKMMERVKNWKASPLLIHQLLHYAWTASLAKSKPIRKLDQPKKVKMRQRKKTINRIAVVTLATGNYWKGAQVLFQSLEKHGMPDFISRIVLSNDPIEVSFASRVSIAQDYSQIKTKEGQFAATANKFAALTLNYDRIILIDSDIFCVKDCSFLWSDSISKLPFYAVHDSATFKYYPKQIKQLGLKPDLLFNAGTMVYNKNLLPNLHDNLLESIQAGKCQTYDGGDQGYFNAYFQNTNQEVGYLANGYNYLLDPNMPQLPEYARYLFHFAGGGLKPWDLGFDRKLGSFLPYIKDWRSYKMGVEKIFTDIYQKREWIEVYPSKESHSGIGSQIETTKEIRQHLPKLLEKLKIKSMLDIPCGDFNWMQHVELPVNQYIGADIVKNIINVNQKKHSSPKHKFTPLDLLEDTLPKVDLILCRDCLGHLSIEDAQKAIKNIKRSGARYLLATTYSKKRKNRYIPSGGWYPCSLQSFPFNFSEPIEILNENCQERFPHFNDKSLALWKIEDLPGETK